VLRFNHFIKIFPLPPSVFSMMSDESNGQTNLEPQKQDQPQASKFPLLELLNLENEQAPNDNRIPMIDWEAALEQCGGDQEFLLELLEDFWTEMEQQLRTLNKIFNAPHYEMIQVKQVCHGIKGAAANLMCPCIRERAFALEQMAFSFVSSGTAGM